MQNHITGDECKGHQNAIFYNPFLIVNKIKDANKKIVSKIKDTLYCTKPRLQVQGETCWHSLHK